ncbi:DUF7219 family protein [Leptolyngbya ohadii]|uniref:DUF7219 family protein n=1 Tax=Leptolyngbya ohadii TaxID=1962290 RepID=UPI000B59E653|nr:hypothetical protein [Leptolyngbya ohadii]
MCELLVSSGQDGKEKFKEKFLYARGSYRGEFTPEHLAFNANLQEFAHRVALICGLEINGKLSPEAAYQQIRDLWHQLDRSKQALIDAERPPAPDLPPE